MIISIPKKDNSKENDLLAITKDEKFIGYGKVKEILEYNVLIEVDKKVEQIFNKFNTESTPYSFNY